MELPHSWLRPFNSYDFISYDFIVEQLLTHGDLSTGVCDGQGSMKLQVLESLN